jgi:putative hydrolase of the HAD superfamily
MIRNFVFDMGGVLIHWLPQKAFENQSEEDGKLLYEAIYCSADWKAFDHGDFGEEEMIARAKARLPERLHNDAVRLVRWYELTEPVAGMEDLAREIREAGYALYLLSNTSSEFHRFRGKVPALRYFEGEFISADVHLLKPDPAIFRKFLEVFSLKPEESLFIDDWPPNVDGAKSAGMDGIVFPGTAGKLKSILREKHLLP